MKSHFFDGGATVVIKVQDFLITGKVTMLLGALSDAWLKRDIVKVGQLENGINLYRYLLSDQDYVGVRAQEVAQIIPDAVTRGSDGYLRVNYARLGLKLQTWDEWHASPDDQPQSAN